MAAAVLSAMIVWCNVTVGISRSLSPLYHLIAWSEHEFFSQVRSDPVIACSIQLTSSSVPSGCQHHVRSCLVACGLPLDAHAEEVDARYVISCLQRFVAGAAINEASRAINVVVCSC